MESWVQRIFLAISVSAMSVNLWAQDDVADDATILEAVINPDIERRDIDEDLIDAENFEFGLYSGVMSVEDFGSNNTFGYRMAFHITEDWFFEGTYGTTKTQETSFELLNGDGGDLLDEEQRNLSFYNLSLGLNLLHGEVFVGKSYAFNTSYYVIAGVGNTRFANDEYFTLNYGAGFRFFATDWLALRVDFRNHLFSHTLFGEEKSIQNLEAVLGASLYF